MSFDKWEGFDEYCALMDKRNEIDKKIKELNHRFPKERNYVVDLSDALNDRILEYTTYANLNTAKQTIKYLFGLRRNGNKFGHFVSYSEYEQTLKMLDEILPPCKQ